MTGTHFPSFSSHEKQSFYMLLEVSKKSSPHSLSKHLSTHPWLPPTPILLSHFSLGTTHKLRGQGSDFGVRPGYGSVAKFITLIF